MTLYIREKIIENLHIISTTVPQLFNGFNLTLDITLQTTNFSVREREKYREAKTD